VDGQRLRLTEFSWDFHLSMRVDALVHVPTTTATSTTMITTTAEGVTGSLDICDSEERGKMQGNFTVMIWAYVATFHRLLAPRRPHSYSAPSWTHYDGQLLSQTYDNNTPPNGAWSHAGWSGGEATSVVVPLGKWSHLAATYVSGGMHWLYFGGVQVHAYDHGDHIAAVDDSLTVGGFWGVFVYFSNIRLIEHDHWEQLSLLVSSDCLRYFIHCGCVGRELPKCRLQLPLALLSGLVQSATTGISNDLRRTRSMLTPAPLLPAQHQFRPHAPTQTIQHPACGCGALAWLGLCVCQ
jgi:hypothetical protein